MSSIVKYKFKFFTVFLQHCTFPYMSFVYIFMPVQSVLNPFVYIHPDFFVVQRATMDMCNKDAIVFWEQFPILLDEIRYMSRSIYSEWQYWITGRSTCVSNNFWRIQYLSKEGTNKKYIDITE